MNAKCYCAHAVTKHHSDDRDVLARNPEWLHANGEGGAEERQRETSNGHANKNVEKQMLVGVAAFVECGLKNSEEEKCSCKGIGQIK